MAYYYGNDPASQYNQTDANSIQSRQLRRRRLGQALGGETPALGTQEEPDRVELQTPEAPTQANGRQRMIQPLHAALGGNRNSQIPQRPDLFNGISSVEQGYKQLLGREADPDGLAAMNQNPQGLRGALNTMYNSDEGKAYRQSQLAPKPQTPPTTPVTGQGQTYDSSQWDTDGWGTPQYLGKAAGGAMAGWDQKNWDDQNMQTPKYVVGRILSNYTPSMDGLGQAMQEIQQAYPGATFDGKDKIEIPGLGTIDVLVNAGGDNMSWAWQDLTNDPQANGPLMQALGAGTDALTNPIAGLLEGLDPSVLQNPQWREMLKSLGVNI